MVRFPDVVLKLPPASTNRVLKLLVVLPVAELSTSRTKAESVPDALGLVIIMESSAVVSEMVALEPSRPA